MTNSSSACELLLIDGDLLDLKLLIANLRPGVEARVVSRDENGVAALSDALSQDFAAVHVVAHGEAGKIALGNTTIDAKNASALPASGIPLNIYACRAGAGEAGLALLEALGNATCGTVSAATGPVGHAAQGGAWLLDAHAGDGRVPLPFTSAVLHWPHVLATVNGTSGDDTLNGTASADTITGGAGNDTMAGAGGNDTFVYNPGNGSTVTGDGNDVIDGGSGTDRIQVTRLASEGNWYDIIATDDDEFAVQVRNQSNPAHAAIAAQSIEKLDIALADQQGASFSGDLSLNEANVAGSDGSNTLNTATLNSETQINADLAGGNDSFYAGTYSTGANVDGGDGIDTADYSAANGSVDIDLANGTAIRQNGTITDIILDFENATGGAYADNIRGTTDSNILNGGGGNDVIDGRGGNDAIDGGEGFDTVVISRSTTGRNDIDVVATAAGFDVEFRSTTGATPHTIVDTANVEAINIAMVNNDAVSLTGDLTGLANATITGSAGTNTLSVANMTSATKVNANLAAGNDTFRGGAHATGVNVDGGSGIDHADYSGLSGSVELDLTAGTALRNGIEDSVRNFENVTGTAGDDVITGTTGVNVINGGGGADTIYGLGGNDTINGGGGNDAIYGGDGDNTINYAAGNGTTVAGGGNDLVDGGAGTDTLSITPVTSGRNDIDVVATAIGFDVEFRTAAGTIPHTVVNTLDVEAIAIAMTSNEVVTLSGDLAGLNTATITGNSATNTLSVTNLASGTQVIANLSSGNDVFRGGAHAIGVSVDGGIGTDHADYAALAVAVNIDLAAGTAVRAGITDSVRNFENATGTSGDDVISGTIGANSLNGGAGADIIHGLAGNDTINGGAGADQIYGGDGADTIVFAPGNGTTVPGSGNDVIDGGAGTDTLTISALTSGRNDIDVVATAIGFDVEFRSAPGAIPHTVINTSNVETLGITMTSNEVVTLSGDLAGLNTATITGNIVANTLSVVNLSSATQVNANLSSGNDIFRGGAHATGVNVDGGIGTDHADYSGLGVAVNVDLAAGTAVRAGVTDSLRNFENATGTAGNDIIRGTTGANVINGGGGDDVIFGFGGNDTLNGGDGDGTLYCGGGNDVLNGGNGNDVYVIDGSVNIVEAPGGGIDTVRVGHSYVVHAGVENLVVTSPIVVGGGASVTITGHSGDNVFYSNDGGQVVLGNGNTFIGGGGVDTYYINGGDTVIANGGRHIVYGAGATTIIGGAGDDDIECHGNGNDTITGGKGNDTIAGGDGNDTFLYTVGDGNDRIDGGGETGVAAPNVDRFILTSDAAARNFTIAKAGSGTDIASAVNGADVLVGYTGTGAAQARMDEVEHIEINAAGGALNVTVGDMTGTAVIAGGIVVNSGSANDVVDVSGSAGGRTVIFNDSDPVSSGDTDIARLAGARADYAISLANGVHAFRHIATNAIVLQTTNVESFNFVGEGVTIDVSQLPVTNGVGTSGNDYIRGTPGADTIDGGDGDDIIIGGGGNDVLIGGNGNDTIYCGGGDDVLIGGDGDDLYVIDGSATIVEVPGTGGVDTVHTTQTYVLDPGVENVRVISGPGGGGGVGVTITGNGGDNVFHSLGGGGGIGGGSNVFIGGGGVDTFYINGGDTVIAGGSSRIIVHGAGSTTIIGGDGDDIIECHGSGNDTIRGGRGDDTIYGGDGDDTFLYTVGDGRDRIDGGTETGTTHPNFDRFIATSDAEDRTFIISRAGSGTDIPAGVNATDVLFGYTGTDAAQSRMDEVEYIELNAAGGGAMNVVVGNLTDTALTQRAIVVNSGTGNDVVDLTGASGGRTVVFNDSDPVSSGDSDTARLAGLRGDYTITLTGDVYSFLHIASGVVVLEATNVETFYFQGDGQSIGVGNILNAAPTAADDMAAITEDAVPNTATGNVLTNDSANDPAPDTITVTGAAAGNTNAVLSGSVGSVLNGIYGTLTIASDGSYTYTLDNTRFATNELTGGQVAHDIFSYTITDSAGATSTAQVDIAVTGNDDGTPFNPNIQLVSASGTGLIGNGQSYAATISADGRYVTFHSAASNLVGGDTAARDIFTKDLITGVVTKVSASALAGPTTNPSLNTATSADGKWQTFFVADAASGVAGDTNGAYDVFARNVDTGLVYLVSKGVSGGFTNGASTFDASNLNVISYDGRTIVFQSTATDIVSSDTNGQLDVFAADNSNGIILAGTASADGALTGTAQDDRIAGLAGNDTINAGDGADRIWGDAGNDTINAGAGDDVIYVKAADGNDTIDGGSGYDTIVLTNATLQAGSFTGIEAIRGDGTADWINVNGTLDLSSFTLTGVEYIRGLNGNDVITGTAGNDVFAGNLGTNVLSGGDGNDDFHYGFNPSGGSELWSMDTVNGGSGYDRLLGAAFRAAIGITSISGIEEISANGQAGVKVLASETNDTLDFTNVKATNLEYVEMRGGDDTVILGNTVGVGIGNGFGNIAGYTGSDTFIINGAGYRIYGGDGNGDTAGYTDVIKAAGDNAVIGLNHVQDIEIITADGHSNVTIVGTDGNDTFNLTGTSIVGISGPIDLGAGNDTFTGTSAANVIVGGAGSDTLYGVGGNDTFRFASTSDAEINVGDYIGDFNTGDTIDLGLIDALESAGGNQAFNFIGNGFFSGAGGEVGYMHHANGNTYIYGDTNSDGLGDFQIALAGHRTMTAADFVL